MKNNTFSAKHNAEISNDSIRTMQIVLNRYLESIATSRVSKSCGKIDIDDEISSRKVLLPLQFNPKSLNVI